MNAELKTRIRTFWDHRAHLEETAGTNDHILKRLELDEVLRRVPRNSVVLDIGSGTGVTLCELGAQKACVGLGIDYSPRSVEAALAHAASRRLADRLDFRVAETPGLHLDGRSFQVVISERCLINLTSRAEQRAAFDEIRSLV